MPADETRPVIISGAGIAGLTAALAFSRRGFSVHLFEQASHIESLGAGIQLSPNATRILDRLGVLDALRAKAVQPQAVVLKEATTLRELAKVPLGEAAETRWHAPYLVTHRADLQQALMAATLEAPNIELTAGTPVRDIITGPESVAVLAGDKAGWPVSGSLLIGADGVWSTVRRLCRNHADSRFTGELAWRATIRADSSAGAAFLQIGAMHCVTAFLNGGFHLVAYPISAGAAVNLVAFTPAERIADGWSGMGEHSFLERAVRREAPALVDLIKKAGPWSIWPLHTVDAKAAWTASNIALIGDAAHAMTPFAAQGAAMAIEDAETLAHFVSVRPGDLPATLQEWESVRRQRVLRVIRRGALNRLAWHAAGPVALARNLLLKSRPAENLVADLDWLYSWGAPVS
jgi:salicylate hydroxylase